MKEVTPNLFRCQFSARGLEFLRFQKPVSWANGFFIGRCITGKFTYLYSGRFFDFAVDFYQINFLLT